MTLENEVDIDRLGMGRKEEKISRYTTALESFFRSNGIVKINLLEDGGMVYCFREGAGNIHEFVNLSVKYPFIAEPENPDGWRLLKSPEFSKHFFESRGVKVIKPRPIINRLGTTLFISAGVQILEDVMYLEKPAPQEVLFVAQPVFRTQFIDSVAEGTSTSFINICTESVNQSPEAHFNSLKIWFKFLQELGLKHPLFLFVVDEKEVKWGDKSLTQRRIKMYYGGLEVGDAIYIDDFPWESRNDLQISDIGFGLERARWVLEGSSYWRLISGGKEYSVSNRIMDHTRTLALLAGSGLKPHYKSHGYRFRQLSKKLIGEYIQGESADLDSLAGMFYDQWSVWTDLPVQKDEALDRIKRENIRNFNAELIKRLKEHYPDVDVDIDRPTNVVVRLLKGTSATPEHVQQILGNMGGGVYL